MKSILTLPCVGRLPIVSFSSKMISFGDEGFFNVGNADDKEYAPSVDVCSSPSPSSWS